MNSFFNLENVNFEYAPYPIGHGTGIFDEKMYAELVRTFPSTSLFKYMPQLGHKYSLSEVNNPENYHQFIQSHGAWKALHQWIKGPDFIPSIYQFLKTRKIDLGLKFKPHWKYLPMLSQYSARFEFSMLPAHQGNILPHTDSPSKIITLVISMMDKGEWEPSWGGGTEILVPKDIKENFNYLNRYLAFNKTEKLKAFDFVENACVIFIKTFNSLHAVSPMQAPETCKVMRKTLTINIEDKTKNDSY